MLKLLKFMGLAIGLVFVVVAFTGATKLIHPPCSLTGVFGGPLACDKNFQWDNDGGSAVSW